MKKLLTILLIFTFVLIRHDMLPYLLVIQNVVGH